MAKKYTRKKIHSMDELDLEQERIKYKARRIEDDWLDILNPQQLAIGLLGKILTRKAKAKSSIGSSILPSKSMSGIIRDTKQKAVAVTAKTPQPAALKIAKKVGISFVRWQLFNLGFFLAKKAYKTIKEKRKQK